MLVETIRLIVVLAAVAGAYQFGQTRPDLLPLDNPDTATFLMTAIGAGLGYVGGGAFARGLDRLMNRAEGQLATRHASEVLAARYG
jgi:hypothetical protein